MVRSFILIFVLLLGTLLGVPTSGHAEPVRVRAAAHGDSGRIAFNWGSPVSYSARISGLQLEISFGREIDANLAIIQQTLPGYVQRGEIGGDGRTVTLQLTKPFDLVHFPTASTVVIDLVGAPFVATAAQPEQPPAPTEAASEPAAARQDESDLPEIGVRTGRHADKVRLVFDWLDQIDYRVDRDGGVTRLVFDSPARVGVEGLATVMPDLIGDARSTIEGGQTVVSLAIAEGARLENLRAGTKVVLDAYFPSDGSRAAKLPPAPVSTVGAETPTVVQNPETTADAPTEIVGGSTSESVTEPGSSLSSTVESDQSSAQAAALEAAQSGQLSEETAPSVAEEKTGVATNGAPPEQEEAPTALTPPAELQQVEDAAAQQVSTGAISTGASTTGTGFELRFAWDEPVAAAVFRRGGALWMVFDKPATVDVDTMRTTAGDAFQDLLQLNHPAATILRAVTKRGINPVPKREGLTWLMEFAEQSMSTLSPVEADSQPNSPVGARIFLPVPEPGRAIPVTDPEMGDNFVVVPVIPLGYGVAQYYEYPQFRIRPSSQGLVVEPTIDSLRVRSLRQGVGITSTRTLHVSPVSEADVASARADSDRPLSRIVDLEPLKNVTVKLFSETRQQLESLVAFAKGDDERTDARMNLIQFFLAHGMAAEPLGVLKVLADDLPAVKKRADFRLYRGMANFLMARYDEAKTDLEGEQLDGNDEGRFWRSLVDLAMGDIDPAVLMGVRSTSQIVTPYPRALRIPLTFWVADASVRELDSEKATEVLEALGAEELTAAEQSQLAYFQGLNNEVVGDFETAILNWETAMQGDHRPSQVLAALARIELLLRMDRISRVEAIEEMESLRFAWRGGDFEFNLLRRLGGLYLGQGGFREGLTTLRQAATYFREREDAQEVTQQMSDTFTALYLRGVADRMAPVSAIALYEEFKELTPVADLGNEMIRKLADRLVGVDLLTEAAELLDNQIKFRLKDAEKSRVGAQLAVVKILAKDFTGAIEALEISETDNLPSELVTQRRHLNARALLGMERNLEALALIEEDTSPEAEKLRAEAYWAAGDWPRVAQAMRELVRASGARPGEALSEEQALHVLNYAIALTLGGNDRGLLKLREDYRAAMIEAEFGDAFTLIATPEQFGLIEYDSIAARVQVAENFRDFMASYKERLAGGDLSSIN